jgi:hypothetical protein
MPKHHHKRATLAQADPAVPTNATQTAVVTANKESRAPLVSAEAIRLCAYRKWESAGKPTGDGTRFWLEAEQELQRGK